jgi:hypothetical protein
LKEIRSILEDLYGNKSVAEANCEEFIEKRIKKEDEDYMASETESLAD